MLFLGAAAGLVMLYYKPVWLAYRNLSRVYKKGTQRQDKPDLPVLQASYLYRQDQTMGLVTLLIDLCRRGVLTLNYAGGEFPWSVSRKTDNSDKTDSELNTTEKKIIEILLQNKATIPLKASLSDPEPDVQEAAEELFREIKNNNHQISHRKSLFPVYPLKCRQSSLLPCSLQQLPQYRLLLSPLIFQFIPMNRSFRHLLNSSLPFFCFLSAI